MQCGRRLTSPTSSARRSAVERPAQLGQAQAEQVHDRHLADEGLRRSDADLEPGAGEQHAVGVARGLRAHHVGDREHARAALAREAHRGERVGRLARLRDPEHEVAGPDDRVAVAVLRGDVHLDGQPRPLFDRVASDEARVVGGAAGDDHDPSHVPRGSPRQARPAPAGRRRRRARCGRTIVSATASACSWISFSMNVSKPPFSAVSSSQSTVSIGALHGLRRRRS